eukprot:10772990-Ditylum_brightwellii.AAC.1
MAFVGHFLAFTDLEERTKNLIVGASCVQIENAVKDYDFIGTNPSMITAASILDTAHFMDRTLLPDGSRCSLSLVLEQHGSNRLIYGNKMREIRDNLLNSVRNKEVANDQQGASCKTSSPTLSNNVQEKRAASPISIQKGPSYIMGSF